MPSILIIEDDDLFGEALADALTERGHIVRRAPDGLEGLKLYRAEPTDVVLTDIVMPNQDGTALIGALRQEFSEVGIIAMSGGLAHDAPLYLKIASAFGADRTLKKPFTVEALMEAIDAVTAGQPRPLRPQNSANRRAP